MKKLFLAFASLLLCLFAQAQEEQKTDNKGEVSDKV